MKSNMIYSLTPSPSVLNNCKWEQRPW